MNTFINGAKLFYLLNKLPDFSSDICHICKGKSSSSERSSPVRPTLYKFAYFIKCLCSSDHGFIAYDTNIVLNYDNSPRKQKFTDISLSTNSPKSPRRTLESSCKLESTLTEESSHLRQGSHLSGISGQDSEDYDSDSLERFGSGWDTLYHMRSSFRSKMKDKENFSKSVEPRPSVKDSLKEVCNYTPVLYTHISSCDPWLFSKQFKCTVAINFYFTNLWLPVSIFVVSTFPTVNVKYNIT